MPDILYAIPEIREAWRLTLIEVDRLQGQAEKIGAELHSDTASTVGLERKENLSAFESAVKCALRDANAEGNALDNFIAEMKKVKGKTSCFVNEMRLTKGTANVSADFVVDLQYALKAADVVRKRLAVRPRLLADWETLKNGDEKSEHVRKATARLILEVPELLK